MKKFIFTAFIALLTGFVFSQSHVHVKGYYKSNGTYVKPHYRTSPNNTVYDNWSTYPNVNPYTNQRGTKHYYNNVQPQTKSYQNYNNLFRTNPMNNRNSLFRPNPIFN
jgi:hypothetical protein